MTTYTKLKPHVQFKNKEQMDEQVTKYRQSIGYQLTKSDNKILNYMQKYAVRYTGVFYQLLETISTNVGISVSTVKRALSKLIKFGIVKRIPTRKENGRRKGATIYQFQFYKSQNELKKMNLTGTKNKAQNPSESKDFETPIENKPFIFSNKDLGITNTTDDLKNKLLKDGLLSKLPTVVANAIKPFFESSDDLFNMAGTIFRAKAKVSKSIRIEEHGHVFYNSIVSVFNSWKRSVSKEISFNVFAVMYTAIEKTTASIVDGTVYATGASTSRNSNKRFEKSPDWLHVNKDAFAERELVPDWMATRNAPVIEETVGDGPVVDFEAERLAILAGLGY